MLSHCFYILAAIAPLGDAIPLKQKPLAELESLISCTEKVAAKQKALKDHLETYLMLHDIYLNDIDNKELLFKTAIVAKQSLDLIKEERLSNLFDSSFLSEMTLFAKLAAKPSIPKIN